MAIISAILDGRGAPDERIIDTVAPSHATVALTGFNAADTFGLTFDARALPLDPQIIKSVAVKIFLYAANGVDDNRAQWATPENQVLDGLIDDDDMDWSASGRWVTLSGRDLTGILLDVQWDPKKRVPTGVPISQAFAEIIADRVPSSGPFASRFVVSYESDDPEPIIGQAFRASKKRGQHVKPGKSLWDVMYKLALQYGFLAYVDGATIRITEPRIQTVDSLSRAPLMVYGRNLARLNLKRRFGRDRVPIIVVSSYNPRTRTALTARWPPRGKTIATALGIKKNEEQYVIAPRGITDIDVLTRFARTRAENLGRAETAYSWDTAHLLSLNSDRSATTDEGPSLLRLRYGDAVNVQFDPFNAEEARSLTGPQIHRHLVKQGYTDAVSQVIAANFQRLQQYQQPYYTKTVQFEWAAESGLMTSWEGQNFAFVPREEANAS